MNLLKLKYEGYDNTIRELELDQNDLLNFITKYNLKVVEVIQG